MKIAIYPGSFDPITNGHLDIIKRSSKIFDKIIVAVLVNIDKNALFVECERVNLIKKVTKDIENIEVISFSGLLVNLMREYNSNVIIKGLRNSTDFEYEFQMSLINSKLNSAIETLFMPTSSEYSFLSSSVVKQIVKFEGDIKGLVPEDIRLEIINKIKG